MTPMLNPAGNADPRQQVAPPSTSNGVHPPGSASCTLLLSYKKQVTPINNITYYTRRKFLLLFCPF